MARVNSSNGRCMAETSKSCFNNVGEPCSPILNMASDHLFTIMLLLPAESIISFSLTCKKMYAVTTSDALWEYVCKREWGTAPADAIKASSSSGCSDQPPGGFPWSWIYKQVAKVESVTSHRLLRLDTHSEIPSPRASHSLNFVSDCLVLFGGGCSGGRHLDDTWVAHIGCSHPKMATVKWKKVDSGTPSGRFGHTCVVIGDHLVLFAGINDRGMRHNDTWVGHLVVDENAGIALQWRLLNVGSILPPPRGAHAACSINKRKMVIHGGIGVNGTRLGDTWVLDVSENLLFGSWWEVVAHPSPPPCSGHTLTTIGETKTVLFGGRGSGYEVMNDVWILLSSSSEVKWLQVSCELSATPLPRVGHSATSIMGGKMLIYGGEDSNRHRKNDFWLLDVTGKGSVTWRRLKGKGYWPQCRSFHRACAERTGRYVFVFGGMVDGVLQPSEASGLMFDNDSFFLEVFSLKRK